MKLFLYIDKNGVLNIEEEEINFVEKQEKTDVVVINLKDETKDFDEDADMYLN